MPFLAKRNPIKTVFFAAIAPELSKEKSKAKRRVDKKPLVVHLENSMRHNKCRIQECFARKKMTRTRSHRAASGSLAMQTSK
jgi:hypothetical protein